MMKTTLYSMEHNISYVPAITLATRDIRSTVGVMRVEVDGMKGIIANLNQDVYSITGQVNSMTWQMGSLDPAVQHIGRDVNRMSGPMRMFNNLNPLD